MITGNNHSEDKYPKDLDTILSDQDYKKETVRILTEYRRWGPWKGSISYRIQKLYWLHNSLCDIYDKDTALFVHPSVLSGGTSGSSCHVKTTYGDFIVMKGRVSVLTYLHEFGHALKGMSEFAACRWSINLFREIFPDNFKRLVAKGHYLYPSKKGEKEAEETAEEKPAKKEEITTFGAAVTAALAKAEEELIEDEDTEITFEGEEGEDVVVEGNPEAEIITDGATEEGE